MNVLYVGIDLQNAFGREAMSDRLKTLGGDELREVANNVRLAEAVYHAGGTVVVTKDWHNPVGHDLGGAVDNRSVEEFAIYGEHAIPGTGDTDLNAPLEEALRRLEAHEGQSRTVIPVDEHEGEVTGESGRLVEVHKNLYDVTKRVALDDHEHEPHDDFLDLLRVHASRGELTLVMAGKIAEVCVRAGVLSVLTHLPGTRVLVPEDAVSSLPEDLARQIGLPVKGEVMAELTRAGAEVTSTAAVLSLLQPAQ